MKKKEKTGAINVGKTSIDVNVNVKMSLWSAIKLRIAGIGNSFGKKRKSELTLTRFIEDCKEYGIKSVKLVEGDKLDTMIKSYDIDIMLEE